MAVKISILVEDFESCVGKAPYPTSGSGSTDLSAIKKGAAVDCSGIFVAAFKHQGASIYHGSNTIWRTYLSDKGSISNHGSSNGYPKNVNPLKSTQLQVGMAVFKWNPNTPSKFNDDAGDYQHIGLVTSINPLRIVHSTSENNKGVTVDTKIGKWCAWGKFKACNYETTSTETEEEVEDIEEEISVATTTNGTLKTKVNLNIREGKGTSYARVGGIPAGKTVAFTGNSADEWVKITYNKVTGYICTKKSYVTIIKETATEDNDEDLDSDNGGDEEAGAMTNDEIREEVTLLKQQIADIKIRLDDILEQIS